MLKHPAFFVTLGLLASALSLESRHPDIVHLTRLERRLTALRVEAER